jgi:transcriptional accessory protein Tex/SPT6
LTDVQFQYAPFKPASKKSLYERAKALNLEEAAISLLYGNDEEVSIPAFVRPDKQGLESAVAVRNGMKHIISHLMAKNSAVLAEIQLLKDKHRIELTSKETVHKANNKENTKRPQDAHKFEIYFQFSCPIRFVKSHQVLAINRGENLKVLSVKVETPDNLKWDLKRFIEDLYMKQGRHYRIRSEVFQESFEEAYTKKCEQICCHKTQLIA